MSLLKCRSGAAAWHSSSVAASQYSRYIAGSQWCNWTERCLVSSLNVGVFANVDFKFAASKYSRYIAGSGVIGQRDV